MIERILKARADLNEDSLKGLITKKKNDYGGLLTDRGALYLVASDLGVSAGEKVPLKTELQIKDLVAGVNDASVTGRVISIYPPQSFTGKDGKPGKLIRLIIADRSGTLKVNLWGDQTGFVEENNLRLGQIARIQHGYVKNGLDEKPELNVGFRAKLVLALDAEEDLYPKAEDFRKKISEVNENDTVIDLRGFVSRISEVSTFKKKDGQGSVQRILIEDDTGKIVAVAWNEKVEWVRGLRSGDYVEVARGRVKKDLNGRPEVHIESGSTLSKVDNPPKTARKPALIKKKISELQPRINNLDITGRVVEIGSIREFERQDGSLGRVVSLLIGDETGEIRVSLWDENTNVTTRLNTGDLILIEDAYSKEGLNGGVELSLGRFGRVRINPEANKTLD